VSPPVSPTPTLAPAQATGAATPLLQTSSRREETPKDSRTAQAAAPPASRPQPPTPANLPGPSRQLSFSQAGAAAATGAAAKAIRSKIKGVKKALQPAPQPTPSTSSGLVTPYSTIPLQVYAPPLLQFQNNQVPLHQATSMSVDTFNKSAKGYSSLWKTARADYLDMAKAHVPTQCRDRDYGVAWTNAHDATFHAVNPVPERLYNRSRLLQQGMTEQTLRQVEQKFDACRNDIINGNSLQVITSTRDLLKFERACWPRK
jgi:hypothetical protein